MYMRKILVVEDEDAIRAGVALNLRRTLGLADIRVEGARF